MLNQSNQNMARTSVQTQLNHSRQLSGHLLVKLYLLHPVECYLQYGKKIIVCHNCICMPP